MLYEVYYIINIRSRTDGKSLTARVDNDKSGYLFLFKGDFDALSYLNTHTADLANRLTVEPIPATQVGSLLKRWGFAGVGMVDDPLLKLSFCNIVKMVIKVFLYHV
jgi:hypothetical protein